MILIRSRRWWQRSRRLHLQPQTLILCLPLLDLRCQLCGCLIDVDLWRRIRLLCNHGERRKPWTVG